MKKPTIKTKLPGPKASELINKDQTYVSPSYTRVYPLVVDQAEGIWVRDVDSQDWAVVDPVSWGTNALTPPQRFVDAEGRIEVKVATSTIEQAVSVDLSAILRETD